jgi:hypothetical protein
MRPSQALIIFRMLTRDHEQLEQMQIHWAWT